MPLELTRALDLTDAPFVRHAAAWMQPVDYAPCQSFADRARRIAAQAIRYASVRDPAHRPSLALLDPQGLRKHCISAASPAA